MAALLLVFLSVVAAQTQQICQLRVLLRDKGGDGWNGNQITIETDVGTTLAFEDSGPCGYSERTSKLANVASLTLSLTNQDAFKLSLPFGASLRVNYTGLPDNEADENSWVIQLWDVRQPYGEINLLQGGPYVGTLTSSNTLSKVTCGPAPVCAVGAVNIGCPDDTNEFSPYVTDISWAGAFTDSTQLVPTHYQVSWCDPSTGVDCSSPDNYKHVGRTASNHLQAMFPPGGDYQLSVEAYNQFGLSASVITPFSTQGGLPVSEVTVIVSDTQGDGWPDDAAVMITLNGIRFASIGFPCSDDDTQKSACKIRSYKIYAPAEVDLIFEANFLAPGNSADECSFDIILGATTLSSGLDAQGPTIPVFVYPVNLPASPYTEPPDATSTVQSKDCGNDVTSAPICATIDFSTVAAGTACTVPGVSCRSTTTCGTCQSTRLWTCQAAGTWASQTGCSCDQAPSCASFQILTTSDCCNAGLSCQTDENSLACNGPTPWGDCIPDSSTCGKGKQYRNNYIRGDQVCQINTESQTCDVPCPVDCVGTWSGWSDCSATCGSAYQINKYVVSVFPKDGGNECDYQEGEEQYQQCPGLPDCDAGAFNCYYDLEQYDIQADGWGVQGKLNIIVAGQDPIPVTFVAPTADLTYSKQVTGFVAPNGSTVNLNFICQDSDDVADLSYSVQQVIPLPSHRMQVREILQNPANLALNAKPTSDSFVASCVNCANTDCASKHRVPCEYAQAGDLTCGPCLPGYGLPKAYGDSKKPGTSTCVDLNECSGVGNDQCALTNQKCQNIPGGFKCTCEGNLVNGQCVPYSPAALLQRESGIKRDIRWAKERLEHQHFLRQNPPASFAEMEARAKISHKFGLIPSQATNGFYIARCDAATHCKGKDTAAYYTNSSGVVVWVGDDHLDNINWNYAPGYAYSSDQNGGKSAAPQLFKTDGSLLSYATYPSYGRKNILPDSNTSPTIPYGVSVNTAIPKDKKGNAIWGLVFTQDPNSCCWAISHKLMSTGTLYNWNPVATSPYPVKLASGQPSSYYKFTFWNTYQPTTSAPAPAPAPAPVSQCGAWNQTCCSGSCGQNLYCEQITLTCQTPCPSITTRKEWQEMTYQERDTFVRAIQILGRIDGSKQGFVMGKFRALHKKAAVSGDPQNVHENSWFLPWHRYLLLDYNQAIKNLGGEFACVGIPYWDWTKVSLTPNGVNDLLSDVFTNAKSNGLWKGIGNIDGCTLYSDGHPFQFNTYGCQVTTGCDSSGCWFSPNELADNQAFPGTYQWNCYQSKWVWAGTYPDSCLVRNTAVYNNQRKDSTPPFLTGFNRTKITYPTNGFYNGAWGGYGPYAMYDQVLSSTTYRDFNTWVGSYGHIAMHVWIGGFMGGLGTAAMDPAFFMVHATVDMLWAAWQDCTGQTPLQNSDVTNQNPLIWDWYNKPFSGSSANMPWFVDARTPAGAFDIKTMGYQYTNGFIQNVLKYGGVSANYCQGKTSGGNFVSSSFLQATERVAKRTAIYHDPENPPHVVATSFLEAFTSHENKPVAKRKAAAPTKAIAGAKRKKKQAIVRGTLAKPGCYTPKKDEVNNLKGFNGIYKKVRRGNSYTNAIKAVKDAECDLNQAQTAVVGSAEFIESMGGEKERAQGKLHHKCFMYQSGKNKDKLKSDYTKSEERAGRKRSPKKVTVAKPSPRFTPLESAPAQPAPPASFVPSDVPPQSSGGYGYGAAAPAPQSYRFVDHNKGNHQQQHSLQAL